MKKDIKVDEDKKFNKDDIFNALKQFTIDCVHGADFDQGNSEKQTLSILYKWWDKYKSKI